jgi:3-phytase
MRNFMNIFAPLATIFTATLLTALPVSPSKVEKIKFLGQVTFPTNTQFENTQVGGLSGITYDSRKKVYYSVSDDRSERSPARFYTLRIDVSAEGLGKVEFIDVTTLLNAEGQTFAPLSLDPEGITLSRDGTLYISSEGDTDRAIAPFVNQFSLKGKQLQALPIPNKFLPTAEGGVRSNLAFESLTISPNQNLYTATENAIVQDGDEATTTTGSPVRILQYNLTQRQLEKEFLYFTDPVAAPPSIPGSFSTNGLVDLLSLGKDRFLSLERSFSTGVGNAIKLYQVSLENAQDISQVESLKNTNLSKIKAANKKLLLDLADLNITLDNVEGLTFGPCLADGRRSLILVSDNNFSPTQITQILAFSVETEPNRCPVRP